MNKIKVYGYALLIGALLIASSNPIAFKIGSGISVITLLFYMSIVGTVAAFFMMLAKKGTKQLKGMFKNRNLLFSLVISGALSFVISPLALAYATHYVSADLSAVILRTWPILLLLLAPFVIREKITKWELAGVIIGFAGLGATLVGGTAISLPAYELPFVGVVLVAALAEALSAAVSKRYNYELTASVFVYNVISLLIFAPLALYANAWQLPAITSSVLVSILFLGIFTEAIFAYAFYGGLRLVKTSIASTSFIICSFITMLLSAILLGEAVEPYYVVIAITVVAGVLVQKFAPKAAGNFITSKRKDNFPSALYDVTAAFVNTHNPVIMKTMKGNGRVLAFSTKFNEPIAKVHKRLRGLGHKNLMLFTDKSDGVATQNEIEFVREIVGCSDDELLVFGSGDPEETTEKFFDIKNSVDKGNSILQSKQ